MRTIHRDMDALSGAGVPVFAERGNGGGWSLMEAYRTNLTGLNHSEIQTLFLTNPPQLLADLGLHQASEGALIKLLAALPSMSRHDAEQARQRIHIDTAGWRNSPEDVSALPVLQEAIWQERQIQFVYERVDCDPSERIVDPLGLVARAASGIWWRRTTRHHELIESPAFARCKLRIGLPSGRPASIWWHIGNNPLPNSRPASRASTQKSESHRLAQRSMMYLVRPSRIENSGPIDADGWRTLDMRFDAEHEACQFALSMGREAEVLHPETLRSK